MQEVKMDIWELWPVIFFIFSMIILGTLCWIEVFGILFGIDEVFTYLMNAF